MIDYMSLQESSDIQNKVQLAYTKSFE